MSEEVKAFRGANGWYTAFENSDGFHYQPSDGGSYSTKAAALVAHDPPYNMWVDYDGSVYDNDTGEKTGNAEDYQT